ncbi:MAG: DEAD/DEAH box helicase [Nocardioidaceae bacterium]
MAVRAMASSSRRCGAASTWSSARPAGSDYLEKGTLDLSELRFCVLDEADEMLTMGFAEDVETILATPDAKRVALFSATMPPAILAQRATTGRSPRQGARRPRPPTSPALPHRRLPPEVAP